jgi:thioredoxin-like negative regulator of GroEL
LLTTAFSIARARGLLLDRRWREADALVDEAIARCHGIGEGFAMPELLGLKARIAEVSGQGVQASIAFLEQALALSLTQGAGAWTMRTALALATQLALHGQPQAALERLERATAAATDMGATADARQVSALLATLREAGGDAS